jgi:hypothetical protein
MIETGAAGVEGPLLLLPQAYTAQHRKNRDFSKGLFFIKSSFG